MGSSLWDWSVGYMFFFWRCPREFWSGIRHVQNWWQVVPKLRFIQTHKFERDKEVAAKEFLKLAKVTSRGYLSMI